jgi:hypothetical protein
LAVGPDDPSSKLPRVYLFFHNLFSGNATQNMFVETSTDGGSSFGAPVPLTIPGTPEWLDLQCGSSTGPTGLVVSPTTGRLHAVWGVRGGATGGCGQVPLQPFTIVAQNRLWAATSPDGSALSWTSSLAVDDASSGDLVGMQLAGQAIDTADNLYVVYPESPHPYPDFTGAAVRVRWAPPDLSRWSAPITIAPQGGAGNVLTHIVAGEPGKFDVAYYAGEQRGGRAAPLWYTTVAQVLDGMSANPTVVSQRIAAPAAYSGTASELMSQCGNPPAVGVDLTVLACARATDVWGIALDARCNVTISWPTASRQANAFLGASVDATWVDTQIGGTSLCGASASGATVASADPGRGLPATARGYPPLTSTTVPGLAIIMILVPLAIILLGGARAAAGSRRQTPK